MAAKKIGEEESGETASAKKNNQKMLAAMKPKEKRKMAEK
jgi:hypothetical protein